MQYENVNDTVSSGQAGGSSETVLKLPYGSQSISQQEAAQKGEKATLVPDTSERREAVQALSTQWGAEFSSAWLEDPGSKATEAATMALLQRHWGEGWQENLTLAKQVVSDFASPALRKALDSSGLGNDPSVIMFMGRIAAALSQAKHERQAQGRAGEVEPLSPAKALDDKIETAMADPAYFDDQHPNHKRAVSQAERLFAARYPG